MRFASLIILTVFASCTTSPTPPSGPDAGGKSDDVSGSCIPDTCQPGWCAERSDGCGGTLYCGTCETPESDPSDPAPITCQDDDNEPDSLVTPYDFGSHPDHSNTELWFEDAVVRGGDADYYTVTATDSFNLKNPEVAFGVRSDSSVPIRFEVEVECHSKTAEIQNCGEGEGDKDSCTRTLEPGEDEAWMQISWHCVGPNPFDRNESATVSATVVAACDGVDCACAAYDFGVRVTQE